MLDEYVRMDGSNAIRVQHVCRKVTDVERHDFLSAAMNGSSEHVAIIGIR